MKTILAAVILIFSVSPQKHETYVHTREFLSETDWIDSVTVPGGYLDLRYQIDKEGLTVVLLGCKVNGTTCDSPAEFKRMVSPGRVRR